MPGPPRDDTTEGLARRLAKLEDKVTSPRAAKGVAEHHLGQLQGQVDDLIARVVALETAVFPEPEPTT